MKGIKSLIEDYPITFAVTSMFAGVAFIALISYISLWLFWAFAAVSFFFALVSFDKEDKDEREQIREKGMSADDGSDDGERASTEQERDERDKEKEDGGNKGEDVDEIEFKRVFPSDAAKEREIDGESRDADGGGNHTLVHKLEGVVTWQTIEKDGEEERVVNDKRQCHITLELTTPFGDVFKK